MNAREVLQALLDGKIVMEKFPEWREEHYRLKGNDIERMYLGDWVGIDFIPLITPECASVKEIEE